MRKWIAWCIDHRLKFIPVVALLGAIPVYIVVGVYVGCTELFNEWMRDFRFIREAKPSDQTKGESS